jgi:hypothetical protein
MEIETGHIFSTVDMCAPEVTLALPRNLELISGESECILYMPEVLTEQFIELVVSLETASVYELEVEGGDRPIEDIKLYPAEGYGVHMRSAAEMNVVIQLLLRRIDLLEQ